MHVLPEEDGRSVIKPTPRCDQGLCGMGRGWSLPAGKWRGLLEMAHSLQPWMNLLTSRAMPSHQKRLRCSKRVALVPGWPVPKEASELIG